MPWRNSEARWGALAQLFHWGMLVLFVTMFVLASIMVDLPKGPEKAVIVGLHKSTGITILILALARLLWRWSGEVPKPLAAAAWQQRLAGVVHVALYGLMFAMPLSGYVMSMAAGRGVNWFGLLPLPDLVGPNKPLSKAAQEGHELLATLLLLLIALHVVAALWHHFVVKDATLRRMLPFSRVD